MAQNEKLARQVGSVFDLPGKSLRIVRDNLKAFLVVNILSIVSAVALTLNPDGNKPGKFGGSIDYSGIGSGQELAGMFGLGLVIGILLVVVAFFLFTMSTSLEVRVSNGEKPELNVLFEDGKKYFFRLLGLSILDTLIVVLGFILLIVPGVIAFSRLAMSAYHMLDKDLGIIDSLKASNENAKGKFKLIWAALLLMILIAFIGGIIKSIPFIGPLIGTAIVIAYSLVLVLRYQEIKNIGADERT